MSKFKERREFLNSIETVTRELTALGFAVEGSVNINNDTAFEITVTEEEGIEGIFKNISDIGGIIFDGYTHDPKDKSYRIVFCQKTDERRLRDELFTHLVDLGFLIKEVSETSPNKGFIFSVKTKSMDLLKKLETYKTLIFDGYTPVGDNGDYNVFYIFPKED